MYLGEIDRVWRNSLSALKVCWLVIKNEETMLEETFESSHCSFWISAMYKSIAFDHCIK